MAKSFEDFDAKERVREAIDIVELIGGYLDLRSSGRNFVAHCPWHDDNRPSLQINPERQSWKCWVCNIGGDIFSFVQQREGVDFVEALRMLADRAGVTLGSGPSAQRMAKVRDEKQAIYQALSWAEQQFCECLAHKPQGDQARDYLVGRNISGESLKRFQVGYAPDQWSWLIDRARAAKIELSALEAGGLVTRSERNGNLMDRFRGRVIFPIRDTQQRPIAFGGRILPEIAKQQEAQSRSVAKYINSPETKVFSKSETLYGLNLARDQVVRQKRIVVMEGYTDVVIAWQHGIDISTAVLGTALNERHIRLIQRYAEEVVLVLDGDEAGQRRTNDILDLFVGSKLNLRVLSLPDQLDPADFLEQQGAEAFLHQLERAPDALDHKLSVELRGFDPLTDTYRANKAAENVLRTMSMAQRFTLTDSEARLKEQQITGRLARMLALPEDELRKRLAKLKQDRRASTSVPDQDPAPQTLNREAWEKREIELIHILMLAPSKIDTVMENIGPEQFVEGVLKQIFELYCECYQNGHEVDFKTIMTAANDDRLKSILAQIADDVDAMSEFALAKVPEWLQHCKAAFARVESDHNQLKALSKLHDVANDKDEEALLVAILREKQREQEINPRDL